MQVREVMSYMPATVAPETAVHTAWVLMQQYELRHLPVQTGRRLVGIVSDRDVRTVLPSTATPLEAHEIRDVLDNLTVSQVMTRRVITVSPDVSLTQAVDLMFKHKIGALPVVECAEVVGMLTRSDVLRAYQIVHDDMMLAGWDEPPLYTTDDDE